MTVLTIVVALALFTTVACLAGRWGADSRPADPDCYDAQWPFVRHDG